MADMDDNTISRTFPLGTAGRTVSVSRPTDGQLFALALIRSTDDPESKKRIVTRIVRVMEKLIGPDQWESEVVGSLIDGDLTPDDLMTLVGAVLQHNWGSEPDDRPADLPLDGVVSDDVIADALASGA